MDTREDLHINTVLWQHAWESSYVQLAHQTLLGEINKYGLDCEPGYRFVWQQFISDVLYELLLYGYCIHRSVRNQPTVFSGRYAELVRASPGSLWRPRVFDSTQTSMQGTKGWRVLVVNAPLDSPSNQYVHPTSVMFRALPSIVHHRMLVANMLRRDQMNSSPSVFTTVSDRVGANSANSRPWFNQVHSALVPNQITGRVDFKTLVRHRAETIAELQRMTDQARKHATSNGPVGSIPERNEMQHEEHMITDGRDIREVRHLQQDNEIVHYVTERTGFTILQIFGVPPQALGHNVNSERLASSNRLTEMSIQHFRTRVLELKQTIEDLFTYYDPAPKFGECVALHTVHLVKDIVKPDRLMEMYACALDLEPGDFDINLIQASQQQARLQEQRKPRQRPTEDEKDEARKEKAEATE